MVPLRQDMQPATAVPVDLPLFQAWDDGQAIPDFPATWGGDDEFMDNILQREWRRRGVGSTLRPAMLTFSSASRSLWLVGPRRRLRDACAPDRARCLLYACR